MERKGLLGKLDLFIAFVCVIAIGLLIVGTFLLVAQNDYGFRLEIGGIFLFLLVIILVGLRQRGNEAVRVLAKAAAKAKFRTSSYGGNLEVIKSVPRGIINSLWR
jgi:hypothetical protein